MEVRMKINDKFVDELKIQLVEQKVPHMHERSV